MAQLYFITDQKFLPNYHVSHEESQSCQHLNINRPEFQIELEVAVSIFLVPVGSVSLVQFIETCSKNIGTAKCQFRKVGRWPL